MMELGAVTLAIVSLMAMAFAVWALLKMEERARDERRELEDRLMAVCTPIPLMQVTGERKDVLGSVTYVDEEEATARKRPKSVEV